MRLPNLAGLGVLIAQLLNVFFGDDFVAGLGGQEAVAGAFQIVLAVIITLVGILSNTFFRKTTQ